MDKMKMHSPNGVDANIARIRELFPNCVTESQGDNGQIRWAVDFDLLRQELSASIIEGPQERYQLNWPGKREALLAANAPITKTLRPCREESVNFDTTQNLFIEGDNLEALKLLQETYLGKIKLIYIDPPYNTGTNLIYKNDFSSSTSDYLEASGQYIPSEGKLTTNPQTNGRFHSDWLTMIYARIKAAKNMLADNGVLVIAIDENELSNLSNITKEIFGETSYRHDYVSVVHNPRGQQGINFSYVNEYLIFIYPNNSIKHLADFKKEETDSRNLRDSGTESDRTDARNCFYPFIVKNNKIIGIGDVPEDSFHPKSANTTTPEGSILIWPMTDNGQEKKWRYARQSVEKIFEKLEVKQGRDYLQIIFNKDHGTMRSVWSGPRYDSSEHGSKLLDNLIAGAGFTYPKSLWAVYDCIHAATDSDKEAIVLDFFAGSGTTAHATLTKNLDDGGNRRFILVQIPQPCDLDSKPYKNGYKNIADICKERIRKAGESLITDQRSLLPSTTTIPNSASKPLDIGFRVLKIDSSNMADVYYTPDETLQGALAGFVDNVKADRTAEDLLFQVMLDWGVDLGLPIARQDIQGKEVFFVDGNALAACFDKDGGIDEAFCRELATYQPLRVVFRDAGFAGSDTKISVEEIFRVLSPGTEVKHI